MMKIANSCSNYAKVKHCDAVGRNSFGSATSYIPRCYREVRDIANSVYEHSKGSQKLLMSLYKLRGENLNNMITAVGTAGVAPFFIRYNPFSREDKDSKAYTAWRQPISAGITLGGQLLVMSNYNKLLDRQAAYAGVDEMDLRAKPPVSVLKPKAELEYKAYKSQCILNGEDFVPRKKWVANRVVELQDEAFYTQLKELRKTMDISKVPMTEIIKSSDVNSKKNVIFKEVLREKFGFNEAELNTFDKYNDFIKNGKKLVKAKNLRMAEIQDSISAVAETEAIKDLERAINFESHVKFNTSKIFKKMQDELSLHKLEIMKKYSTDASEAKSVSVISKIEAEIEKVAQSIYEKTVAELKENYEKIMQIPEAQRTREQRIAEFAYNKVVKQGSIKNIKTHGQTLEDVIKSVKIKKWLINRINYSETKLKVWKDRSGLVVGLLILPITCTILNWTYPKIMKKLFPRLSEVKEAKKAALKDARQAELAKENKSKEAK